MRKLWNTVLDYLLARDTSSGDTDTTHDPRVTVQPVEPASLAGYYESSIRNTQEEQGFDRQTLLVTLGVGIGLFIWWTVVLARGGTVLSIIIVALVTIAAVLIGLRIIRGPLDIMTTTIEPPTVVSNRIAAGLALGEEVLWQDRKHPISLMPWWLGLVGLQVAAVFIVTVASPGPAMIMWLVGMAVIAVRVYIWSHELICLTNKRIVMVVGLISTSRLTMPLNKMTDQSAKFTATSNLLAALRIIDQPYANFVIESAGQDQALSSIHHLPNGPALERLVMSHVLPS